MSNATEPGTKSYVVRLFSRPSGSNGVCKSMDDDEGSDHIYGVWRSGPPERLSLPSIPHTTHAIERSLSRPAGVGTLRSADSRHTAYYNIDWTSRGPFTAEQAAEYVLDSYKRRCWSRPSQRFYDLDKKISRTDDDTNFVTFRLKTEEIINKPKRLTCWVTRSYGTEPSSGSAQSRFDGNPQELHIEIDDSCSIGSQTFPLVYGPTEAALQDLTKMSLYGCGGPSRPSDVKVYTARPDPPREGESDIITLEQWSKEVHAIMNGRDWRAGPRTVSLSMFGARNGVRPPFFETSLFKIQFEPADIPEEGRRMREIVHT